MEQNRIKNVPVRFWVTPQIHDKVHRIAIAEGRSSSSVYRDLIEKGLVAAGYQQDTQDVLSAMRSAVNDVMKPQIERLASISAKATQISAAAYFMAVYAGKTMAPEYLKTDYDEAAIQARKLGVEYLKLPRERSIDDFIAKAFSRMEEDE